MTMIFEEAGYESLELTRNLSWSALSYLWVIVAVLILFIATLLSQSPLFQRCLKNRAGLQRAMLIVLFQGTLRFILLASLEIFICSFIVLENFS